MKVTCSCTRTMTADGRLRAGNYRCGCGVRVTLDIDVNPGCAAGDGTGQPCPKPAILHRPVRLCADHLQEIQDWRDQRNAARKAQYERDAAAREPAEHRARMEQAAYEARRLAALDAQKVVYYVRMGDLIKIGTTCNMRARMTALMPDAILATEPGSYDIENQRHRQFAAYRVRGERFQPHPDLLAHIRDIVNQHGEPRITTYPKPTITAEQLA